MQPAFFTVPSVELPDYLRARTPPPLARGRSPSLANSAMAATPPRYMLSKTECRALSPHLIRNNNDAIIAAADAELPPVLAGVRRASSPGAPTSVPPPPARYRAVSPRYLQPRGGSVVSAATTATDADAGGGELAPRVEEELPPTPRSANERLLGRGAMWGGASPSATQPPPLPPPPALLPQSPDSELLRRHAQLAARRFEHVGSRVLRWYDEQRELLQRATAAATDGGDAAAASGAVSAPPRHATNLHGGGGGASPVAGSPSLLRGGGGGFRVGPAPPTLHDVRQRNRHLLQQTAAAAGVVVLQAPDATGSAGMGGVVFAPGPTPPPPGLEAVVSPVAAYIRHGSPIRHDSFTHATPSHRRASVGGNNSRSATPTAVGQRGYSASPARAHRDTVAAAPQWVPGGGRGGGSYAGNERSPRRPSAAREERLVQQRAEAARARSVPKSECVPRVAGLSLPSQVAAMMTAATGGEGDTGADNGA